MKQRGVLLCAVAKERKGVQPKQQKETKANAPKQLPALFLTSCSSIYSNSVTQSAALHHTLGFGADVTL